MAYNKDSGESKLRKEANQDAYARKKNKNIFKNSQSAQSPPPKPEERKANYEWDMPDTNIPDYNRQEKEGSRIEQESLSFKDIILIIIANAIVPIIGGFVYYIALSAKGYKQKAVQSIVLSAIVSIIRIMYIPHISITHFQ
jgi:hypothetical protein